MPMGLPNSGLRCPGLSKLSPNFDISRFSGAFSSMFMFSLKNGLHKNPVGFWRISRVPQRNSTSGCALESDYSVMATCFRLIFADFLGSHFVPGSLSTFSLGEGVLENLGNPANPGNLLGKVSLLGKGFPVEERFPSWNQCVGG